MKEYKIKVKVFIEKVFPKLIINRKLSTLILTIVAIFFMVLIFFVFQGRPAALQKKMTYKAESFLDANSTLLWSYDLDEVMQNMTPLLKNSSIIEIIITEKDKHLLVKRSGNVTGQQKLSSETFTVESRYSKYKSTYFTLSLSYIITPLKTIWIIMTAVLSILVILIWIFMIYLIWKRDSFESFTDATVEVMVPEKINDDSGMSGGADSRKLTDATREKLDWAIQYIQENYRYNISREGLAAKLNINPDNLGRFFKIYTGEKISECINRLRIDETVRLITETDSSITEILYKVGFDNASTFYRAFVKYKDESPSEFKEKVKKKKE